VIAVSGIPRALLAYREQNKNISDEEAHHRYYAALGKLLESKTDPHLRLRYAMVCLSYIEPSLRYAKREFGVPAGIPAIPEALTFHAINGARGQLESIREIVEFLPDLAPYRFGVEESFHMLDLAAKVRAYLAEHPGTLQNKLKKAIEAQDGKLLSRVVHYMELVGQLERRAEGKTWALFLCNRPGSS
jgi:hypothetical protein